MTHNDYFSSIKELILFSVAGINLGLSNYQVLGIQKNNVITKVFRAPDYIRGVVNLRGAVVTIIDLRIIFGYQPIPVQKDSPVLIIDNEREKIGLLVDEITNVISIIPEGLEPPMANIDKVNRKYFCAIYKDKNQLIAVLDIQSLLAA